MNALYRGRGKIVLARGRILAAHAVAAAKGRSGATIVRPKVGSSKTGQRKGG